jgi:hypothetical protein
MKPSHSFCLLPLACFLVSCASPEYRIKKNPDLFATFPPEVQEKVRNGQIDLGYTPEMVTMALGAPNHTYNRTTREGSVDVWSYTSTKVINERQRVNADFRYRDSNGKYRNANDWVYVDVAREVEYDKIRVEFKAGIVSAIDTLQR